AQAGVPRDAGIRRSRLAAALDQRLYAPDGCGATAERNATGLIVRTVWHRAGVWRHRTTLPGEQAPIGFQELSGKCLPRVLPIHAILRCHAEVMVAADVAQRAAEGAAVGFRVGLNEYSGRVIQDLGMGG